MILTLQFIVADASFVGIYYFAISFLLLMAFIGLVTCFKSVNGLRRRKIQVTANRSWSGTGAAVVSLIGLAIGLLLVVASVCVGWVITSLLFNPMEYF